LEGEIGLSRRREGVFDPARRLCDTFGTREERFAAVKDYDEAFESFFPRVLSDALGELTPRGLRHEGGLSAPALIGVLVHVAVVTRQVTARGYLDEKRRYTR
jgi:hypothetical protein